MKRNNYDNMSLYEVDCPRWVQRRMRANLAVAARSKVNRNRASIAKAILETIRAKQPMQVPVVAVNDSPKPAVSVVQVVQPEIRTERPKLWTKAKAFFGKLARNISISLPARRLLRLAHH